MTDELVAFLKDCLDEDEQVARDAHYEGQRWLSEEEDVCRWPDDELVHIADRKRDAAHIARHDPARVLAEVAAKRRIIDEHSPAGWGTRPHCSVCSDGGDSLGDSNWHDYPCLTLRLLASVYAGRPGWRGEWAADEEAKP